MEKKKDVRPKHTDRKKDNVSKSHKITKDDADAPKSVKSDNVSNRHKRTKDDTDEPKSVKSDKHKKTPNTNSENKVPVETASNVNTRPEEIPNVIKVKKSKPKG